MASSVLPCEAMNGLRTAIILGAGASYCYEDGITNLPTQENIIEQLFFGLDTTDGEGAPSFVGSSGLKHSFALGQYIRKKFNLPEDPKKKLSKTDFWPILQEKGYTLESLYEEFEHDTAKYDYGRFLIEDFEAIVRTAVTEPNSLREPDKTCKYHKMLCEVLEPGDFIINFNWDTLMADALLLNSHFWFPGTGFGVNNVYPLMRPGQKQHNVASLVQLFHVHGAVCLFEWLNQVSPNKRGLLYLGPQTYTSMNSFFSLLGFENDSDINEGKKSREPSDEETRRLTLGYIHFDNQWFKPIFTPPSRYKKEYRHWYTKIIRSNIHSLLPTTQQIIIAGYSFPVADIEHLRSLFVKEIINPDIRITVVNPSNKDSSFRQSVKTVFSGIQQEPDYTFGDFREYCNQLENPLRNDD